MAREVGISARAETGRPTARLSARASAADVRAVVIEGAILFAFLALTFVAFADRLGGVVVSDMDEGTYLLAGKLVAAGAVPYRDFMLTHPPVIAYLAGLWVTIAGPAVMPARFAYSILVLASTVPLYLVTRSLSRSRAGAFFAVGSYVAGMLLLANMGRTIRLEPVMNAALIAAVALHLRPKASPRRTVAAGVLLGVAVLIKLVAVVPIVVFLAADALWRRKGLARRWSWLALGSAAVLVPAVAALLGVPRFVDDVIGAQLDRPGLPVQTRIGYVIQDLVRDPLIPFGIAASCWLVLRARDPRLRAISLVGIGSTVLLVVAFRTFFGYYLVQVLPWLSVISAVALVEIGRRSPTPRLRAWSTRAIASAAVVLGIAVPIAYAEVYDRTAHDHVGSAAQIAVGLQQTAGSVYSMYPSFALWTGRETCGTYYVADSLIPRITGRMRDDDFVALFSGCGSLVLWTGELADYPRTDAYVQANFKRVVQNQDYALWTRTTAP